MNGADNQPKVEDLLKQATLEIRRLRSELQARQEPIAIVGMACRFPRANNLAEFWQLLATGRDGVVPLPEERWSAQQFPAANIAGGFIDDVKRFDPGFFGIAPKEAVTMDPQQRLLLEVSYQALEHAGIASDGLRGSATGVYVGICFDDYAQRNVRSGLQERITAQAALGTNRSIAAGRIAYTFDLQGPVVQLDTTCSSSLVAMHLACQSLRSGESSLALAGGVNLMLSPEATLGFGQLNALAPDGRCRTFSAQAQGYSRGEGCGMLVLKTLSAAQRDGDRILALIRSSAVNHDGASNGLTAPNGPAQVKVINDALQQALLTPDQVQYVEAHGTATPLGDPIEVQSLAAAYGERQQKLLLGSVKTNIGHLESAAGVAGVIKNVLALQQQQLPPHLHAAELSSRIPWHSLPIEVVQSLTPWPASSDGIARAGVSGFGMSGTNAHLILEHFQPDSIESPQSQWLPGLHYMLPLSAQSPAALKQQAALIEQWVQTNSVDLTALCATMARHRSHFRCRRCLCFADVDELLAQLKTLQLVADAELKLNWQTPTIDFIFPPLSADNLAEWIAVAREWCRFPDFRQGIARCDQLLEQNFSIARVLTAEAVVDLSESQCSTLEFCLQYAGWVLLSAFGVKGLASDGNHSLPGQWLAQVVLGNCDLQEALFQLQRGAIPKDKFGGLEDAGQFSVAGSSEASAVDSPESSHAPSGQISIPLDFSQDLDILLATVYQQGVQLQWSVLLSGIDYQRLELPGYPFQRQPFWQSLPTSNDSLSAASQRWPGQPLSLAGDQVKVFKTQVSGLTEQINWTAHRVDKAGLFPATGYLSLLLAQAQRLEIHSPIIDSLRLHRGLPLSDLMAIEMQWLKNKTQGRWEIKGFEQQQALVSAKLLPAATSIAEDASAVDKIELSGDQRRVDQQEIYLSFQQRGIDYEQDFRWLYQIEGDQHQAKGVVKFPVDANRASAWLQGLHPGLLDAGLQLAGFLLESYAGRWLPVRIQRFCWFKPTTWVLTDSEPEIEIRAQRCDSNGSQSPLKPKFDIQWWQGNELMGYARGLTLLRDSRWDRPAFDEPFYQVNWYPKALSSNAATAVALVEQTIGLEFQQLAQEKQVQQYQAFIPQLEHFSLESIGLSLTQLAATADPVATKLGEIVSAVNGGWNSLLETLAIAPEQHSLFARLLLCLAKQQGIDLSQENFWRAISLSSKPSEVQSKLLQDYPWAATEIELVSRCGAALGDVLQGKQNPVELLFPGGDLALLTGLYEHSAGAKIINQLLADTVRTLTQQWPADRPLRVLEVGAGTGASTASLLPVLAALDVSVSYLFSDLSPHFLTQAQQRFANYEFVDYRVLDISAQPDLDDLYGYDLVIASNVLHATPDLPATLHQVASYLRPQGHLLLLEATEALVWLDLVFGMLPGWWLVNDNVRANHPLLSGSEWQQLLQQSAFAEVAVLPGTVALPQAVILAQREPLNRKRLLVTGQDSLATQPLIEALAKHIEFQPCQTLPTAPVAVDDLLLSLDSLFQSLGPAERSQQLAGYVLTTVKQLAQWPVSPKLWLLTRDLSQEARLWQSALWGMVQTIQLEHPELQCSLVQCQRGAWLQQELLVNDKEPHVRWSEDGVRWVPRLEPLDPEKKSVAPLHLVLDGSQTLDGIRWQPLALNPLADNEIRIQVAASGVNFRDVLIALGQYPEPGLLGAECAGSVLAVGAAVTQFAPGDLVMAIAPNSFDTEVQVDARLAVAVPVGVDLIRAATAPVAFVTAAYGLLTLGQLKSGDTLLVHNASGGVGQAAIQIASAIGARIFATASKSKHDSLRALGIEQVWDSRSTEFAQGILAQTAGLGVDLILSALPIEFQRANLTLLSAGGRLIDIGKGESLTAAEIAQQAPGVVRQPLDLVALCRSNPDAVQQELQRLVTQLSAGVWRPLPLQSFAQAELQQALRIMQAGKHLGKLVVSQQGNYTAARLPLSADKTYLITGGLGGLGLLVADWLIGQGARHLCLIGRRASSQHPALEPLRAKLAQLGPPEDSSLVVKALDITQRQGLENLLQQIQASDSPLGGIVHAAGVLDDQLITKMSSDQLQLVLAPKVTGAWLLHQLTQDMALDCFVLFGSAAGVLGAPGQANHATANAFLTGLAEYRRQQGLPGLCLEWGAWLEVGSALKYQAQPEANEDSAIRGIPGVHGIEPSQGIRQLQALWCSPAAAAAVLPIDWQQLLQHPRLARQPLFADLAQRHLGGPRKSSSQQGSASQGAILQQLTKLSPLDRKPALNQYLQERVAVALGLDAKSLDLDAGLFDLGLDSLTALELKNRMQADLGLELPATLLFDYPNAQLLMQFIGQQLAAELAEGETLRAPAKPHEQPHEQPLQQPLQQADTQVDQADISAIALQLDQCLDQAEALIARWDAGGHS